MAGITRGDITISTIIEQQAALFPIRNFLPTLSEEVLAENRDWLRREGALDETDTLVLCFQSYVVRTPHHVILVDTCLGNHKKRPQFPFWNEMNSEVYRQGLAREGLAVDDVDYVMCTHLHPDHVGWNTVLDDGRWVPTFPKARYLFSARELAHWQAKLANAEPAPWIEDSVLPVIEAGRAELIASDHALGDHLRLEPTPGHTPDHFSVQLGRGGTSTVLTGDIVHSPLQMRYPEMSMGADHDPAQAAVTRRRFFECYCDTGTLVCTAHFPSPSQGEVKRRGDAFIFERS